MRVRARRHSVRQQTAERLAGYIEVHVEVVRVRARERSWPVNCQPSKSKEDTYTENREQRTENREQGGGERDPKTKRKRMAAVRGTL